MSWDFVEPNQFARGTGSWAGGLEWTVESLEGIPESSIPGIATQADAATLLASQMLLSTDPPYYDNIGYSDLSDFFYVWLRRALRDVHPELFSTLLVPKAAELVANPYRHDGKEGARQFFEEGFRAVFDRAREHARADLPITVYYAFKQSESGDDGSASTGWETLLEGMISGGWAITATWPLRSELSNRMLGQGTNALASSIVLALRPRLAGAATVDRRGFITALRAELPAALRRLQQGAIAPVDLPQAAIGPGMAVFSRYAKVLDSDGAPMSVRAALVAINDLLDEVLSEHEGDFDAATRFALAWYRQHGYATGAFGDADNLARARNTSVDAMAREGILTSAAGKVTLHRPAAPPADYRITDDERLGVWETLHHLIGVLEQDGVAAVGALLGAAEQRPQGPIDPDQVKDLTFLLFRIAEEQKRTADALSFNQVATSWPEIIAAAHSADHSGEQTTLALEED